MPYGILLTLLALYLLYKYLYSHWNRRGIVQLGPAFPFEDILSTFRLRTGYVEQTATRYAEAVRRGQRFVGTYVMGQPVLLVTDAALTKQILTRDFEYFHNRGSHINESHDPLSGHLFSLTGAKWRWMRLKLTPAFTGAKLRAMFPAMQHCGNTMSTLMERTLGEPVDIWNLLSRFTTDVIASVAFGIECDSLRNPDAIFREMGSRFLAANLKTKVRMLLGFVAPRINRYLQVKLVDDDLEQYMVKLVRDTIEFRERTGTARKDFIQLLLQLRNHGTVTDEWNSSNSSSAKKCFLTVEEMAAQSFVFIAAGQETSSSVMTFCLYELCRNPDIQTKVHAELDRLLANDPITYETLGKMTYLESCIDETLRKYPVSPLLFRTCTKPYKIPGTDTVLDKGTLLHFPLTGLQRDPRYYAEPLRFNPERFAAGKDSQRTPFYSFGDGPRVCIALRLGKLLTKTGLVELLSKYRFTLDSASTSFAKEELTMDPKLITLRSSHAIKLVAQRRRVG